MGRIPTDSDGKTHLVLHICSLLNATISCPHGLHRNPVESHFIDWYRILGVAEDAEMEIIRKQYHKLALQVHPDKNKHPKAEVAFKLVSEAYTCLSNSVRRRAFHSERLKHFCIECKKIPYATCNSTKMEGHTDGSKSFRAVRGLKDIRNRFKEEARVIENCLRTNNSHLPDSSENLSGSRTKQTGQRELPIFNPSDYLFQGYPHLRSQVYTKPAGRFCNLQRGNVGNNHEQGEGRFQQSPVFGNGSARGMFKSKSVCIHS